MTVETISYLRCTCDRCGHQWRADDASEATGTMTFAVGEIDAEKRREQGDRYELCHTCADHLRRWFGLDEKLKRVTPEAFKDFEDFAGAAR